MIGLLHVLYWLRAEGTPRLAQALLREERRRGGPDGAVAILHEEPRDLRPELEAEGFAVHSLEYGHRWRYDSLYRRCVDLLRRLRPTGVVVYPLGPHLAVAAAARRVGVSVVLHIGTAPPRGDDRRIRIIRTQLWAGGFMEVQIAACSEFVRSEVVDAYRVPPTLVHAVPNGIDRAVYAKARARHVRDERNRFGMVASLELSKNHPLLMESFRLVLDSMPNAELRLIGGGSRKPELERLAQSLEIDRAVRFEGVVGDVPTALESIDVFAYCVRPNEGLGIALVEAMAAGLPVVASRVPACEEVTAGGRYGRLVEEDPSAWARALLDARHDTPCPASALNRFDIATCLNGYLELLQLDRTQR